MSHRTETRDATDGSRPIGVKEAQRPHLFVVMERGRLLAGGARHSLANIRRVTLGRGEERIARRIVEDGRPTLQLWIPDGQMSATHARVESQSGKWTIRDCGSTNGMRVNGCRVEEATLSEGDLVELGQTILRYRRTMTPVNAAGDLESSELRGLPARLGTLSPTLARDLEDLEKIARSDVSVLLEGETGTGKEILARAIHDQSSRRGAFVAVNCAALPQGLVESLLFGHKKGAFSGASSDELGFARAAEGGTLFLDEIGDLPESSQAVLLRMLQEHEVVPLGATRPLRMDVRIVAATHRSLRARTESGDFRQDLLSRLAQFTFSVPPLRERVEDIGVLVAAILPSIAGERGGSLSFSARAARELLGYGWPDNVRELERRLKVGALLAQENRIDSAIGTPEDITGAPPHTSIPTQRRMAAEDAALHRELVARMSEHQGNLTQVAIAMGKARRQVQRWIVRFGIDASRFR
jgi:transcriptional regulator with GAF, ATPase, and Fis domain